MARSPSWRPRRRPQRRVAARARVTARVRVIARVRVTGGAGIDAVACIARRQGVDRIASAFEAGGVRIAHDPLAVLRHKDGSVDSLVRKKAPFSALDDARAGRSRIVVWRYALLRRNAYAGDDADRRGCGVVAFGDDDDASDVMVPAVGAAVAGLRRRRIGLVVRDGTDGDGCADDARAGDVGVDGQVDRRGRPACDERDKGDTPRGSGNQRPAHISAFYTSRSDQSLVLICGKVPCGRTRGGPC